MGVRKPTTVPGEEGKEDGEDAEGIEEGVGEVGKDKVEAVAKEVAAIKLDS